ncbi:TPA: DUF2534 family protein [Klebsiella pneumoniae]|uniref:DUF2534 family protein n=1 Tax=Enterobacteriaceae TaxID=543 RepID=UPI0020733058|nr:DUF2534 family protein [Enterobacter bugandensis]HBQ1079200.1 DUF2534 family protein [Klebsiella pneumoniae]HBU9459773.1 DUF2534 family protein [Klebsiella pneumoniae]HBV7394889.1 DUF2534 family protein [Klebsiella pneumoniae]HBV7575961.1 DUF2534 family protein [Klebsiella pneumoniae]
MLKILKTPEEKKFFIAVACVFIVAACVVSKAAFQGVENQYNLPMETWDISLFIIQGAWVAIYTLMFTIVGSLPFGFYFLGPRDEKS